MEARRCGTALAGALPQVCQDATQLTAEIGNRPGVYELATDKLGLQLLGQNAEHGRLPDQGLICLGRDLELDKQAAHDVAEPPRDGAAAIDAVEHVPAIGDFASRHRLYGTYVGPIVLHDPGLSGKSARRPPARSNKDPIAVGRGFGRKALAHFRSTPNNGPRQASPACLKSANALNRCAIARGGGRGAHQYGSTRGEMVSSVWVILS